MKWRLCAAVAAQSLLLSGCSSLLARSYTSVTPHSATPPAEGDSSILRVENYQELVNALIYLISLGEEEGTVRMYNYDQMWSSPCPTPVWRWSRRTLWEPIQWTSSAMM